MQDEDVPPCADAIWQTFVVLMCVNTFVGEMTVKVEESFGGGIVK